jgi:hypothetical protein
LPHPQRHFLPPLGDYAHVFAAGGLNIARTLAITAGNAVEKVQNNAPQLPLPREMYDKEKKHPSNGGNP